MEKAHNFTHFSYRKPVVALQTAYSKALTSVYKLYGLVILANHGGKNR